MPDPIEPTERDWNVEAAAAAAHVAERLPSAHRGVIRWADDVFAVFGNDGPLSGPPDEELGLLRDLLGVLRVRALGFARAGHTWVLLVREEGEVYQTKAGREFRVFRQRDRINGIVWVARGIVDAPGDSPDPEMRRVADRAPRDIADRAVAAHEGLSSPDGE